MSFLHVMVWTALGGLLISQSAAGGLRQDQKRNDESIKLETTLVQVPVVVSGAGGRYVTDLKVGDFTLLENGVTQDIRFFGSIEEPFNVALLLDSSGSTEQKLEYIKQCALAFVDNLRPHDRVMVFSFDDSVHIQSELTGDRDNLRRAIASITPGEFTQVYEAVYTAVWERLQDVNGRKALILFSDGIDNASSEISAEDTLDAVVETEDVIVYPIRYSTRGDVELKMRKRLAPELLEEETRRLDREYRKADEYLHELATLSGGTVQRADQLPDINGAFTKIADELRHQYLLGYYPTNQQKGDLQRRIAVRVSRDGVRVRTRPGYRMTR